MKKLRSAFTWVGSITGLAPGVRRLRKDADEAADVGAGTWEMLRELRLADVVGEPLTGFEEAMRQQGVGEHDLPVLYRQRAIETWLLWCVSAIVWGLLLHFIAAFNWIGILGAIGVASAVTARALRAGFMAWQIQTRRLGQFGRYVRSPGEWWPARQLRRRGLPALR